MFERFTDRARLVVIKAQDESRLLNHDYVGTEHILLGILNTSQPTVQQVLTDAGLTLEVAREITERLVGRGQKTLKGHIPFTIRGKKTLELALREALNFGHQYIGPEHLLLGMMRLDDSTAMKVLNEFHILADEVRSQLVPTLGPRQVF